MSKVQLRRFYEVFDVRSALKDAHVKRAVTS